MFLKLINMVLNTDAKKLLFSYSLQLLLVGVVLILPALVMPSSVMAYYLSLVAALAMIVTTGWFIAGLGAKKATLDRTALIALLICFANIAFFILFLVAFVFAGLLLGLI